MLRSFFLTLIIPVVFAWSLATASASVLRVGYYEGGPFVDYRAALHAIAEALIEQGMIPRVTFPPSAEGESNQAVWAALAKASQTGAIRFVGSAFWTADWQQDKRAETRRQAMLALNGGAIDLMLALGTWAGQDLANDDHSVPTLVISASDPIASGIIESAEDSGRDHIHAECDPQRYIRQIRLFHSIVGFKRIGVAMEDSDDGRAWSNLGDLRAVGQRLGFEVETCFAPDSNFPEAEARAGVLRCWSDLAPRIEALWSGTHRGESASFMPETLEPLFRHKIPTWSQLGLQPVRRGILFSVARRDHRDLGRFYADVIARVQAGVKPRRIPQVFVHDKAIVINARTAEIIGMDLPPGLLSAADHVFERIEGRP
jgi:ABC-type uncharacterized transport system substrate-binding protein